MSKLYYNYEYILISENANAKYFAYNRITHKTFYCNRDMFTLLKAISNKSFVSSDDLDEYGDEFTKDFLEKKILTLKFKYSKCQCVREINQNEYVKRIFLEVSKKCNLNCLHCYANASKNEEDILSRQDIYNLIDQAALMGAYVFQITGGEPFLREDINDILEYLWHKGFMIVIYSNLTCINDDNFTNIVKYGIQLYVSLDFANEKKHDVFRGKEGAFQQTITNIKRLHDFTNNISINLVVNNKTDEELNELINFIKYDLKLDYTTDIIQPMGRAQNNYQISEHTIDTYAYLSFISNKDLSCDVINNLKYDRDDLKAYVCNVGKDFIFVNSKGDVELCPVLGKDSSSNFLFGNIKEMKLSDIWESTKRKKFRRLNCKFADICPKGKDCGGSCRAKAYNIGGDVWGPDPIMCAIYGINQKELNDKANI